LFNINLYETCYHANKHHYITGTSFITVNMKWKQASLHHRN